MTSKLAPGEIAKEPGFYQMTAAQYHADPCPVPSLSSSIVKVLIDKTPRHARAAHPRFGGAAKKSTPAMDLGSLVGKLVLGCGPQFAIIEHDSYRTDKAKEARDDALARGKIPVLLAQLNEADLIAESITRCVRENVLHAHVFDYAAEPLGAPEIVAVWQEDGFWFRAMLDWFVPDRFEIYDLKTSGADIGPHAVGRKIADMGYDIQQAFYVRAVEALLPDTAGRWKFRFVFAETDEPYEVVVAENDATAREMGRRKVSYAMSIWRMCLARDIWPGYPRGTVTAEYPQWAEASWLKRETEDPSFEGVAL